ncbi:hypothetical protein B0H14DRAFT_2157977, partial [Mycena olivaceomarginata]
PLTSLSLSSEPARLGTLILSALAATEKISIILLSRPGSSKTAPPGVLVVPVDYTDVNAVSSVFKEHKVDVPLADAAKLAAVKLFVPSEFGSPTHG